MTEAYRAMVAIRRCVREPDEATAFRTMTPADFARRHGVSESTAELILSGRMDELRDLGVNPICIIYLSRLLQRPLPHWDDRTEGATV
jgi:hypothetical protein